MKILVAEDEVIPRNVLETMLAQWDFETVSTQNGREALEQLQQEGGPPLAILDWMMPELDGIEVCRLLRALPDRSYTYIILLTARDSKADLVTALDAGADDFVRKPVDWGELRSRINAGIRIVELERRLANKITELETALKENRQLKALLPICMYCKKIRDDGNYWHQLESYLHTFTGTDFSHGICPECYDQWMAKYEESNPQSEKE